MVRIDEVPALRPVALHLRNWLNFHQAGRDIKSLPPLPFFSRRRFPTLAAANLLSCSSPVLPGTRASARSMSGGRKAPQSSQKIVAASGHGRITHVTPRAFSAGVPT